MNFARGGSAAGQANAAAMLQAAEFELDTMMGLYNAYAKTAPVRVARTVH